MKKHPLSLGFVALLVLLCSSCYYDNVQKLNPASILGTNTLCDTTTVTYSVSIVNILQLNCYGCHDVNNSKNNGGGFQLDTYATLSDNIANSNFPQCLTGAGGLSAMPKNTSPLPSCEMDVINKWIREGALNN